MSGVKFLSENYTDESTMTLTTGTAHAQFPLSNLIVDSPSIKFRSTGNTAVIQIDLLVTRAIDFIAIAGDPTNTFGITAASVKTSVTTDFSLSTSYPLDLSGEESIGYTPVTSVSHRYVQLTLTGNGSYAELGKVFVGEALHLTQNSISISSFSYQRNDRSSIKQNRYGQKFIDTFNKQKSLGGSIEFCTKDEQEDLDIMFMFHGESLPLWIIIDQNNEGMNDGKFKLTCYGYLSGYPKWSAAGGQHYNTSIEVLQAV